MATGESKREAGRGRNPLLVTVLALGSFVCLLVVVIYLGARLESLEDRLDYRPTAGVENAPEGGSTNIDIVTGQTVYVPVYSHIYSRGGKAYPLEVTLSIRNSDPEKAITITSVRYFDTKGRLMREYLDGMRRLQPLETAEYLVEKWDHEGGSGANFIIEWNAAAPVYEPIIEAVMVGVSSEHDVSFISPGRALVRRGE